MRLALESAVRQDLGLGSSADYIAATLAALDAATMALESDLRTTFDVGQYTDTFVATPYSLSNRLKLKQGFVVPGSLVVTSQSQFRGRTDTTPLDISGICTFDYEKGIVSILGEQDGFYGVNNALISASYTAGFDVDNYDPLLYSQDQVPLWLNELAKIKARIALGGHPALDATGATFDVKNSNLPTMYITGISRRARYAPDALLAR